MEYLPCSTLHDNSSNHIRQLHATSSSENNASPLMYVSFCVQYQDYITMPNSVSFMSSEEQEGTL